MIVDDLITPIEDAEEFFAIEGYSPPAKIYVTSSQVNNLRHDTEIQEKKAYLEKKERDAAKEENLRKNRINKTRKVLVDI